MWFTTLAEPVYIFVWLALAGTVYRVIYYPSGTRISCDLQPERDVYVVWFDLLYRVIYPRRTFISYGLVYRIVWFAQVGPVSSSLSLGVTVYSLL